MKAYLSPRSQAGTKRGRTVSHKVLVDWKIHLYSVTYWWDASLDLYTFIMYVETYMKKSFQLFLSLY